MRTQGMDHIDQTSDLISGKSNLSSYNCSWIIGPSFVFCINNTALMFKNVSLLKTLNGRFPI